MDAIKYSWFNNFIEMSVGRMLKNHIKSRWLDVTDIEKWKLRIWKCIHVDWSNGSEILYTRPWNSNISIGMVVSNKQKNAIKKNQLDEGTIKRLI